jgi:hypothetical protein
LTVINYHHLIVKESEEALSMAELTYKEVVKYFDEVSPDMAELVLGIIHEKLDAKEALRIKRSNILKKARAAKGQGQDSQPSQPPAEAPAPRRSRPPRVNDPNEQLHQQSQSVAQGQ